MVYSKNQNLQVLQKPAIEIYAQNRLRGWNIKGIYLDFVFGW